MNCAKSRSFSDLKFDIPAGFTVALVALPLALGFGVTSGAGAVSGITTAIVAGFLAALLGGSKYQVSGPTGAMVVILFPIIRQVGVDGLVVLGVIAGILIVLFGILKLGNFADKIPWPVMEGFTLGIAVVIALQQLPVILGLTRSSNPEIVPAVIETIQSTSLTDINWWSVSLVALTLGVKISWSILQKSAIQLMSIPPSAIAVVLLSIAAIAFSLPVARVGDIPSSAIFRFEYSWPNIPLETLLYSAFAVALLGAIESLLSARVADAMIHRRDGALDEKFKANQELVGQGLATIAASLLGGMPATGAIARTAVNVNAGARSRKASLVHSLMLLIFVLLLGNMVSQIPLAVLGGVLLGASWRIANPTSIKENLRTTWQNKVTYLATAISVVAIDLIWGIAIGIFVYLVFGRVIRN